MPFDPYRSGLYSPGELYAGLEHGYAATTDATVYAWSRQPRALDRSLAQALHDHAVDDALGDHVERCTLAGRRRVGVMGGHALGRDDTGYRDAARLGHALGRHFTVVTGGGPGAMEAANLGARLAAHDEEVLDEALDLLADSPGWSQDPTGWARAAFTVRERWSSDADTLGVPTWYYGHEPPNAFAAAHAKYFRNAIREDQLLRICDAGIVFLPGAAGTVQEMFQDACAQYYAPGGTISPVVRRRHPATG